MEYRTKSTIEDGITKYWEFGDGRGCCTLIEYQPGNGTRYTLLFTPITDIDAQVHLGAQGGGYVVSWVGQASAVFYTGRGAVIPWDLVAKKLGANRADAVVLSEVIGFITSVKSTTSEEARKEDGPLDTELRH